MATQALRLICSSLLLSSVSAFVQTDGGHFQRRRHIIHSTALPDATVGPRIPINENFAGLKRIYSNPDIFVIENFLEDSYCEDLIEKATEKKLERSPVAYAGKSSIFFRYCFALLRR